jgi:addiction module RelE/StbE family toxin
MRVTWSEAAENDLASVLLYIAADDKSAALKLVDRLEAAGNSLADFPMRGRPGRNPGTRELAVSGTNYIIVYQIEDEGVEILRALHGARDWPP